MIFPLRKAVKVNCSADKFLNDYKEITEIPIGEHPGSFGYIRANHIHEGVDLYAENGDSVLSVSDGVVLEILPFTGIIAGSPWWNDTYCVFVKHDEFIINYGEITPNKNLKVGDEVKEGQVLGTIKTVLKVDKGRPMSMLHLEMYRLDTSSPIKEWPLKTERPSCLLDPTDLLIKIAKINEL